MFDIFKAVILGIIEGITEWLPISSTGHIILADEFIKLGMSEAFKEMFNVVIQLGAIMAVVVLFWSKLWPFTANNKDSIKIVGPLGIKRDSLNLWLKVLVAALPSVIIGLPFDDKINELFFHPTPIALALIIYGVAFIIIENINKERKPKIADLNTLNYKTAFIIGLFQVLAMIPGTSRSGSTILGAMLIGTSRTVAAEFSFYLAVPTMFGASLLKLVKFGFDFSFFEVLVLLTGMVIAFVVSVIVIKFLLAYIRKKDFKVFGWYRIVLGAVVLAYFALKP